MDAKRILYYDILNVISCLAFIFLVYLFSLKVTTISYKFIFSIIVYLISILLVGIFDRLKYMIIETDE